jgi:hypothetical protein
MLFQFTQLLVGSTNYIFNGVDLLLIWHTMLATDFGDPLFLSFNSKYHSHYLYQYLYKFFKNFLFFFIENYKAIKFVLLGNTDNIDIFFQDSLYVDLETPRQKYLRKYWELFFNYFFFAYSVKYEPAVLEMFHLFDKIFHSIIFLYNLLLNLFFSFFSLDLDFLFNKALIYLFSDFLFRHFSFSLNNFIFFFNIDLDINEIKKIFYYYSNYFFGNYPLVYIYSPVPIFLFFIFKIFSLFNFIFNIFNLFFELILNFKLSFFIPIDFLIILCDTIYFILFFIVINYPLVLFLLILLIFLKFFFLLFKNFFFHLKKKKGKLK